MLPKWMGLKKRLKAFLSLTEEEEQRGLEIHNHDLIVYCYTLHGKLSSLGLAVGDEAGSPQSLKREERIISSVVGGSAEDF